VGRTKMQNQDRGEINSPNLGGYALMVCNPHPVIEDSPLLHVFTLLVVYHWTFLRNWFIL
jgi:hypothetical protein